MSSSPGSRPQPASLAALPRRSPLAALVAAQRGRLPVTFFDERATLAATLEATAQQLAATCYAVDDYHRRTGEVVEVPGEIRRAVTALSGLSLDLAAAAAPTTSHMRPGIPGE